MFGDSDKLNRVIPNKVYQVLAMKKPLITGFSMAVANQFTNKREILYCPPGDAITLSQLILETYNNPTIREKLAQNGFKQMNTKLSNKIIQQKIKVAISNLK